MHGKSGASRDADVGVQLGVDGREMHLWRGGSRAGGAGGTGGAGKGSVRMAGNSAVARLRYRAEELAADS